MNINYTTTTITLQLRLQLQLQLRGTSLPTLHPAAVGEVTTAATPKITATFRSISGFALPSMHRNNSPLLQCPIVVTSATALCGTTGYD